MQKYYESHISQLPLQMQSWARYENTEMEQVWKVNKLKYSSPIFTVLFKGAALDGRAAIHMADKHIPTTAEQALRSASHGVHVWCPPRAS
jgi:hypothetical protein